MAKKLTEGRKPGSGRKKGTAKTLAEGRKVGSGRKKGSGGKAIGKTLADGRKAGSGRKKGSKSTSKIDDINAKTPEDSSLISAVDATNPNSISPTNNQQLLNSHDYIVQQTYNQNQSYEKQISQLTQLNQMHYIANHDPHQQQSHQHIQPSQYPTLGHFAPPNQQQTHQSQQIPHLQQMQHHQHHIHPQHSNSQSPQSTNQILNQQHLNQSPKYNDIKLIMNDLNGKGTIENTILPFNRSRQ
ncbi:EF-hand calcium-binding domain-containing protein [Wickerhamomyces ciferrii]|uniref:EF-hand calcium-binding domain-containing protein n=1 Tax=Wickerhamomyces ciferrii (strain ATCC 14091 / BCRC 22168 / CBS 111 / JCM 3599 / NBRC 0793 / NRRL Y-1031 F-60-10) TaxID=1206466 RepID=K0KZ32_WICCF|nr:EF-hand calcium-binding domain-containing protein [Wickerhamomyces ciferrii]CCH46353.1 EF-hand calcium-binding domain-containing protein [Wickerhamomyces ciferrii]